MYSFCTIWLLLLACLFSRGHARWVNVRTEQKSQSLSGRYATVGKTTTAERINQADDAEPFALELLALLVLAVTNPISRAPSGRRLHKTTVGMQLNEGGMDVLREKIRDPDSDEKAEKGSERRSDGEDVFKFEKKAKADNELPNLSEVWRRLGQIAPDAYVDEEWSEELSALILRQMDMAFDNLPPKKVKGLFDALSNAAIEGDEQAGKSFIELGKLSRKMEALEAKPSPDFWEDVRVLQSQIRMRGQEGERYQEGTALYSLNQARGDWLNFLKGFTGGK